MRGEGCAGEDGADVVFFGYVCGGDSARSSAELEVDYSIGLKVFEDGFGGVK